MTCEHSFINGIEGKYCPGYDRDRHWCPLEKFYNDSRANDGLVCICKMCDKKYRQSPNGRINNHKAGSKQRRRARRIRDDLKSNGCAICGYNKCIDALEFHHVNPEDKKFNLEVTSMMVGDEKLVNEINKCIILCSNCHIEIHTKERSNET